MHELDRRAGQIISFVVLGAVLVGIWYGAAVVYDQTYDDVEVNYHSIWTGSLGLYQQSEQMRVRVVVDEGSVKVMEGRVVTVQLLDSDNRASMEQGKGYVPLDELVIDTRETDVGEIEYTAHRTDTYYLALRNDDWYNISLRIAGDEALETQLFIKVFAGSLFVASVMIFAWMYGRLFDVNVRHVLGLVRRRKGPGSQSAREPEEPLSDVIGEGSEI